MPYRSRRDAPLRGSLIAALLAATSLLASAVGLVAISSAQASTLPTLTLTLTKSTITVGGSTQSGGVNVVTTATGVKEATAILFLLKPGVTVEEVENAKKSSGSAGQDPNFTSKYGSIVFSSEASPGHSREAQTYLQPGQYVALIPGEGKGSTAHATFTVSAAASPVALPTPQATVRSIEFGFRGPSTLHDGEIVRFENEGFLVHMDIAVPAKSKNAAKKIVKDLLIGKEKGIEKLAAGEPITFAPPISHEAFEQETITARPGWYVQACFMETQDKRVHTRLGMERIIKIVK
jgi:hypothetical protein